MASGVEKSFMMGMALLFLMIFAIPASARMKYTQEFCKMAPHMITVQVQQVRSGQGLVTAVLYNDKPEEFLAKGKKLAKIRIPAEQGSVDICLVAPSPGTYALVVYHDENGNKQFDKDWLGLPIEGFGVSNNPIFFLVPPSHDEAAFSVVDGQTALAIDLKY